MQIHHARIQKIECQIAIRLKISYLNLSKKTRVTLIIHKSVNVLFVEFDCEEKNRERITFQT